MLNDWILTVVQVLMLIAMSFAVIGVVLRLAKKKLRKPEIKPFFWLERNVTTNTLKKYVAFAIAVSVGATILQYVTSTLITGHSPWWGELSVKSIAAIALLNFAAVMGFLVPRRVYHLFREVQDNMIEKARSSPKAERNIQIRDMQKFGEVAGGSFLYQGICILITVALFVSVNIIWLGIESLFTSWFDLLLYVLIGGIVGPMATTISGFLIYCGTIFERKEHFDPLASDRRGGFKSLGSLGIWSTFMAAVVAGVAIPTLFIAPRPVAPGGIGVNYGLTLFMVICIGLFFFIPLFFVHGALKTAKKKKTREIEDKYRRGFNEFSKRTRGGVFREKQNIKEVAGILSLITWKKIYDDITLMSDWPLNHSVIFALGSFVLPALNLVIQFL